MNRAWDVSRDPPFYKNKPRQLAMALGVSVLFFFSVGITAVFQWGTSIHIGGANLEEILGGFTVSVVLRAPAFLVSFIVFAIIYKILPNTKTQWKYIWVGAVVAGVLFEGGKSLFLWYLDNFAGYDQVYGERRLGNSAHGLGVFFSLHPDSGSRNCFRVRPTEDESGERARDMAHRPCRFNIEEVLQCHTW